MRNNPAFRRGQGQRREAVTGPDGKFQIVVPAGPGHLLVRAASPDYLHLVAKTLDLGMSGSSHTCILTQWHQSISKPARALRNAHAAAARSDDRRASRPGRTRARGQCDRFGWSYRPYSTVSSPLRSMSSVATAFPFRPFLRRSTQNQSARRPVRDSRLRSGASRTHSTSLTASISSAPLSSFQASPTGAVR